MPTFNARKFYNDLKSGVGGLGAALVGFQRAETGAVTRTVQDRLRDVCSVFDFMTPSQIADVQAGSVSVDVTTALQTAIDACVTSGDPTATTRGGLKELIFPAGAYLISAPLDLRSCQFFRMRGHGWQTKIVTATTMESILRLDGVSFSQFSDFQLSTTGTPTVTRMLSLQKSASDAFGICAYNSFTNIWCGGRFITGFDLGSQSAGRQVSETGIFNCYAQGTSNADGTLWQNGFLLGSGSYANVLNHNLYNCHASSCKYGITVNATNGCLTGGSMVDNFKDFNLTVQNYWRAGCFRSEQSRGLMFFPGASAGYCSATFHDVQFYGGALQSGDFWIDFQRGGCLNLENVILLTPAVTTSILLAGFAPSLSGDTTECHLTVRCAGVGSPYALGSAFTPVNDAVSVIGDYQEMNGFTEVVKSWSGFRIGGHNSLDFAAIQAVPDTNLYRAAADVLATDDAFLARRLVEANTAGSGSPNVLLPAEARTLLTNEGATEKNYHTLPTAVAGLEYLFVVQDADGMRVTANTGDTITLGGVVSATAGSIDSTTIDSTVHLIAVNATEWIGMAVEGSWTVT